MYQAAGQKHLGELLLPKADKKYLYGKKSTRPSPEDRVQQETVLPVVTQRAAPAKTNDSLLLPLTIDYFVQNSQRLEIIFKEEVYGMLLNSPDRFKGQEKKYGKMLINSVANLIKEHIVKPNVTKKFARLDFHAMSSRLKTDIESQVGKKEAKKLFGGKFYKYELQTIMVNLAVRSYCEMESFICEQAKAMVSKTKESSDAAARDKTKRKKAVVYTHCCLAQGISNEYYPTNKCDPEHLAQRTPEAINMLKIYMINASHQYIALLLDKRTIESKMSESIDKMKEFKKNHAKIDGGATHAHWRDTGFFTWGVMRQWNESKKLDVCDFFSLFFYFVGYFEFSGDTEFLLFSLLLCFFYFLLFLLFFMFFVVFVVLVRYFEFSDDTKFFFIFSSLVCFSILWDILS